MIRKTLLFCCMLTVLCATSLLSAGEGRTLFVVDARELSPEKKFMLITLQGVANRSAENEFLFVQHVPSDAFWLSDIQKRKLAEIKLITAEEALKEFGKYVKGLIIYDPRAAYTINIATTMAGIEDAFISDVPIEGFKTIFNCKNKWKSKVEAYTWAIDNLMAKVDKKYLAVHDETLCTARDFYISLKVFVFDLDPINNSEEIELFKRILSYYPPSTPLLGWCSAKYADESKGQNNVSVEIALINLISPRNSFLICTDYSANVSVYNRIKTSSPLLQLKKKKSYVPGKVFLTFVYSDGDNTQFDLNRMRTDLWQDMNKSKVPIGWTVAPILYDWGKFVFDKYYSEALFLGNQEFLMGPSGFGYVHPTQYKDLDTFLEKTREYAVKNDLYSVASIDEGNVDSLRETYRKYADLSGLKGVFGVTGFGISEEVLKGETTGLYLTSEDLRAISPQQNTEALRQLAKSGKDMIFCYAHAWDITPSGLLKMVEGCADLNVEVVTPSTFIDLGFQKALAQNTEKLDKKKMVKVNVKNVKGEWDSKSWPMPIFTVKAEFPPQGILNAEVVYWFDNKDVKYFQFLRSNVDGAGADKWTALLPPSYFGNQLNWQIEIITTDYQRITLPVQSVELKLKDSDDDGLDDDFEKFVVMSDPSKKDTDADGLGDKIDSDPLESYRVGGGDQSANAYNIIWECSSENEAKYLTDDKGSIKGSDGHRYADEKASFTYKFPLTQSAGALELAMTLDNNYVVEASKDGITYVEIHRANYLGHDSANRAQKFWTIPSDFVSAGNIFIRISDGSTADGWGGGFYNAFIGSKKGIIDIMDAKLFPDKINLRQKTTISALITFPLDKGMDPPVVKGISPSGIEYLIDSSFDRKRQILTANFTPKEKGTWLVTIIAQDSSGQSARAEMELKVFASANSSSQSKTLIKNVNFVGKEWVVLDGWDEGTCGTKDELAYVDEDKGSAVNGGGQRYTDGTSYVIWKFPVRVKGGGLMSVKIGNSYIVSVSSNKKDWVEILNAFKMNGRHVTDGGNYKEQKIDISKYMHMENVYIKMVDSNTADGGGGFVGFFRIILPPFYRNGERVSLQIELNDPEASVGLDVSSLYKRDAVIYENPNEKWFKTTAEKGLSIIKNIEAIVPRNLEAGIYSISAIAQLDEFQDLADYPIGVGKEAMKIPEVKKVESTGSGNDAAVEEIEREEYESPYLLTEEYVFVDKVMKSFMETWNEGDCGTTQETQFLTEDSTSDVNNSGVRYADGLKSFAYKFKMKWTGRRFVAAVKTGNNFVIECKRPTTGEWVEILNSQRMYGKDMHDMSNYKVYYLDVSAFVSKSKELYIRTRDGSPDTGWGGLVGTIKLFGGR